MTRAQRKAARLTDLCKCGHWRMLHKWWCGCLDDTGKGLCRCWVFRKAGWWRRIVGVLLCLLGIHRWGPWAPIKASERAVKFMGQWVTINVDHEFKVCQRCAMGYRLRPADREGGE